MPDQDSPSGSAPDGAPGPDPDGATDPGFPATGGSPGQDSDLTGMTPTVPRGETASASAAGGAAAAPTVYSRQELRKQSKENNGQSRTRWYVLGGVAVVLIGVLAAYFATRNSNGTGAKAAAATTTVPGAPVATCPLTGAPAPGGVVPARPALGIKIGNYPDDRPSAGLNQADLVFEEPVEGAITRLLAVFQCRGASLVGDLRSAREPDVGILSQLSDPLFVHAGGIDPVIALLASAPLVDDNLYSGNRGSAIIQRSGRVAPYSTFVSTATLWAFNPSDTKPPAPIFHYSPALPAGSAAGSGASVHIPFSSTSDVTWKWNPSAGYQRYYSGSPDTLLDGSQTTAANVVIMTVPTSDGPWVENEQGGLEVQVNAIGSGPLLVMRDDTAIAGTWSRSSLTQPASLSTASGAPITLQPGNTWIELVPTGIPVTPTSAVAAPATTAAT